MALLALLLPVLAVLALVLTARLESWMQPSARYAPAASPPREGAEATAR
ncbi:hypothetical protein [Motilibacter aurantiacus]|nr:hypothetical protein [Motilibacter aurantiacus]NHC45685.1 hypothetical protein [Motilibacter aurantiacus]